jgi:diguanylate cyclase (GGDEF)-like protein
MNHRIAFRSLLIIIFIVGINFIIPAKAEELESVDSLIAKVRQSLQVTPKETKDYLAQLQKLEPTFSKKQRNTYTILTLAALSIQGKYNEVLELARSLDERTTDLETRAWLFYYESDAYSNIGKYELALISMNKGIVLLPSVVRSNSKVSILQAAVTLLNSLHAYEESLRYVDRIIEVGAKDRNEFANCIGLANKVEINFLLDNKKTAHSLVPEAIRICDASDSQYISFIVKILSAIDLVNSNDENIRENIGFLLHDVSEANAKSDYVTKLEEAVARSYFRKTNLEQAEYYGLRAYNRAKSQNVTSLMEISSETMARITRAQGRLSSSIDYFDISLALKKKVLDEQLQKNIAYQRVKFDAQDKANQLRLLEQENKLLTTERQLELGKSQNLLLLVSLSFILLTILGSSLRNTLKQKDIFRASSQIDGMTQISNRAHFVTMATLQFKQPGEPVSVVVFDMDNFKKINDEFGHASGDWVLKAVSASVRALLRKTDIFGRLGGEEFGICLQGLSENDVLTLVERCRAAIAAIDTQDSGHAFAISASMGIATRGNHGLIDFEETLAAADRALYVSKTGGRNRVSVFQ